MFPEARMAGGMGLLSSIPLHLAAHGLPRDSQFFFYIFIHSSPYRISASIPYNGLPFVSRAFLSSRLCSRISQQHVVALLNAAQKMYLMT